MDGYLNNYKEPYRNLSRSLLFGEFKLQIVGCGASHSQEAQIGAEREVVYCERVLFPIRAPCTPTAILNNLNCLIAALKEKS